jgi:hypothetical protein
MQKMSIDYHDFVGIMLLLIINSTISFIEENNAGNAAAALMARLAPKSKVSPTPYLPLFFFSILLFIMLHFFSRFCVMEPGVKWTRLCWCQVT